MRLIHLETGRHLYGGARQVLYLLNGLAAEGIRSTLVCTPDSRIAAACEALSDRVDIVRMPMSGDLDVSFARRLGDWLKANDARLLHVHSRRGADLWGGLAARRAGIPAVLTRRVDNPDTPVIGGLKYKMYGRVIGISEEICRRLREAGVREQRLRLVRSAIDMQAMQPVRTRAEFLTEFGLPDDAFVIACVAQFIPRKGHRYLFGAWPAIRAAVPNARLLLLGQGETEQACQDFVQRAGFADTIHFGGYRRDLPEFLGHADLLVHPVLREGLGVCLLEAQAAGVPVVASRAGGVPEAVADGASGLLVPPGDAGALGDAIIGLARDPDTRARLGAGGRAHMAEHFSVPAMVSGNLNVYRELLGDRFAP